MSPAAFLAYYRFDLANQAAIAWVERWRVWPRPWLIAALLEALYQGRYKAVSVEQVLLIWRGRGTPRLSFSAEFIQEMWPDVVAIMQPLLERRSRPLRSITPPPPPLPFGDTVLPQKWLALLETAD